MKMNAFTKELKKELMTEYDRVSAEVLAGHMTADEANQAIGEEANELFDTCLDQLALLEESGKEFDAAPYDEFITWITFQVLLKFEWIGLCKVLNSEREVA